MPGPCIMAWPSLCVHHTSMSSGPACAISMRFFFFCENAMHACVDVDEGWPELVGLQIRGVQDAKTGLSLHVAFYQRLGGGR